MNLKNTFFTAAACIAAITPAQVWAGDQAPQTQVELPSPSMLAVPTLAPNVTVAPEASITAQAIQPIPTAPNVASMPVEDYTNVSTPTTPVETVIQPLDKTIVDEMSAAYSNQDVEAILGLYGDYELTLVDDLGSVARSREELRKHLVETFASNPKKFYKASVDNIRELSPGTGLLFGSIGIFDDAQDTSPKSKIMFTMVAKHDGLKWKISHMQATEVKNNVAMAQATETNNEPSSMRMMIIALIGAVIGFFVAKLVPNRNKAAQ
jgi:uncharacterized protein (TIGR02246 family)